MNDDRRQVLADFLAEQLVKTPKMLRSLCALALVLCGFGLFVLTGVTLGGAAPISETGAVLVVFLALTGGFLAATVWAQRKISGAPTHPIVTAVRSDASRVNRLVPTMVQGRSGQRPALQFYVDGGGPYLVFMGMKTRTEFIDWLSTEGATIG